LKVSVKNTVLSCEHASHSIPAAYRQLFAGSRDQLISHRGWDPGALACAMRLASKLHLPLIKGSCSRLLIDLNRSLHHQQVFSEYTRALPILTRLSIINNVYHPYRERLRQSISRCIAKHGFALHLSLHTFTPVLNGSQRNADIGILYDPRRKYEKAVAVRLQSCLATLEPELKIRRNYPYRGVTDGVTTQCRRDFTGQVYAGLEIEINQKIPLSGERGLWRRLQNNVLLALTGIISQSAG